jgi:hypothetical protein
MTTDEALRFLAEHQPMPDTEGATEQQLRQLAAILKHFQTHCDERCIPLLLNIFGEGDGHGVYPMVGRVIRRFPESVVVSHLRNGLSSPRRSVREWSAEIALSYHHECLIEPLIDLAMCEDQTLREISMFALSRYEAGTVVPLLNAARERPMDKNIRQEIDDLITKLSSSR